MAHLDTRETVQSGRDFIKKAMKLPMLEPDHELNIWPAAGKKNAMKKRCTS